LKHGLKEKLADFHDCGCLLDGKKAAAKGKDEIEVIDVTTGNIMKTHITFRHLCSHPLVGQFFQ